MSSKNSIGTLFSVVRMRVLECGSDFSRQLSGHDKEMISPVSHARKKKEKKKIKITSVSKVNDMSFASCFLLIQCSSANL